MRSFALLSMLGLAAAGRRDCMANYSPFWANRDCKNFGDCCTDLPYDMAHGQSCDMCPGSMRCGGVERSTSKYEVVTKCGGSRRCRNVNEIDWSPCHTGSSSVSVANQTTRAMTNKAITIMPKSKPGHCLDVFINSTRYHPFVPLLTVNKCSPGSMSQQWSFDHGKITNVRSPHQCIDCRGVAGRCVFSTCDKHEKFLNMTDQKFGWDVSTGTIYSADEGSHWEPNNSSCWEMYPSHDQLALGTLFVQMVSKCTGTNTMQQWIAGPETNLGVSNDELQLLAANVIV